MSEQTEQLVLDGVPKIGYNVHLSPFPGSLYSCLSYLRDPYDYDFLMGVTGAAFRRFWQRDDGGNVDLMYLAPEPHKRAFAALNRSSQTVPKDRASMLRAIRLSLARGYPVLAFGIIGPPECGIVTGYDLGGDVLLGYSYFQEPDVVGYYKQADWFAKLDPHGPYGLIIIGPRLTQPPLSSREILVPSLEWAVDLARTPVRPKRPNHVSGLAAYDAWAAGLEHDDYPADDPKVLGSRVMIHGDQVVMLEERHSAAAYLRSMADAVPEVAAELGAAADQYDAVAAGSSVIWRWGLSMGPEVGRELAMPSLRRELATHVRAAGRQEGKGVELLERALAALVTSRAAGHREAAGRLAIVRNGSSRVGFSRV